MRKLALAFIVLLVACEKKPTPSAPLSPRVLEATPIVPVVREPAPPPAPPRPALTLFASAGLRGRLSPTLVPPPPGAPPRNPGLPPITTGGLARRATIVDRARLASNAVVQVDAGDFLPLPTDEPRDPIAPTPKDVARGRDATIEALRRIGMDAVTLGARDLLSPDARKLVAAFEKGKVVVVLANLVGKDGKDGKADASVFATERMIDAKGTPVGVFGVAAMSEKDRLAMQKKTGWRLDAPGGVARARAAALRQGGAKLVVALVNVSGGASADEILDGADVDVAIVAGGDAPATAPLVGKRPLVIRPVDPAGRVDALDVRVTGADGPAFKLEPRTVPLPTEVPEQLGVNLISRALTTRTIDGEKILAEQAKKKHVAPGALRDLYEAWDFASTKACGYCHEKAVAQWQTTDHAHAFATLKDGKREGDPACLGCHTLGWLQVGGTKDFAMSRTQFADVGCEACHGPSALHVRSPNKKEGTSRTVDPVVCLGCHTPDWSRGFDPVAAMKLVVGPGHGMPAK
jgi:hypothetical protein